MKLPERIAALENRVRELEGQLGVLKDMPLSSAYYVFAGSILLTDAGGVPQWKIGLSGDNCLRLSKQEGKISTEVATLDRSGRLTFNGEIVVGRADSSFVFVKGNEGVFIFDETNNRVIGLASSGTIEVSSSVDDPGVTIDIDSIRSPTGFFETVDLGDDREDEGYGRIKLTNEGGNDPTLEMWRPEESADLDEPSLRLTTSLDGGYLELKNEDGELVRVAAIDKPDQIKPAPKTKPQKPGSTGKAVQGTLIRRLLRSRSR